VLDDGVASPAQAAEHFERALAWYRAGKYRRAVESSKQRSSAIRRAKTWCSTSRWSRRKLGDLAGAIASLQRFQSLEKDPRSSNEPVRRIERSKGAERTARDVRRARQRVPVQRRALSPRARARQSSTGWVIGPAAFALASLLVGPCSACRASRSDAVTEQSQRARRGDRRGWSRSPPAAGGRGGGALYLGPFCRSAKEAATLPAPPIRRSGWRASNSGSDVGASLTPGGSRRGEK
jgi:hypothetical protein